MTPAEKDGLRSLLRDQVAAALAGGLVAAMGVAMPLDEVIAYFDAIRARLYPEDRDNV